MLKYTKLIEQIEYLMDDPTASPLDHITELATEYAQACQKVNDDLVLVVGILREGNASEALRICHEIQLLDNYKTLLFDEYDNWIQTALTFGDVATPSLNKRLADELDATEMCMKPIEEILKTHRKLALSHSPLSLRIPILQKLTQLDPRNTGWKNELKAYQTARLEEIYNQLNSHPRPEDMRAIVTELTQQKWTVAIPSKIKKKIEQAKQAVTQKVREEKKKELIKQLESIATNLQQAYQVYDFETAKRWRTNWLDVMNQCHTQTIIPPFELTHPVDEILSWIESEQEGQNKAEEFKKKVAILDRETRKKMPSEKFQRLLFDVERSADAVGETVPDRFQNHLNKLIASEQRAVHGRNTFRLGILSLIILVVIGVLSFGTYQYVQWSKKNYLIDTLAKYQLMLTKDINILPEAYSFVENLEKSGYELADNPEVHRNITFIKKKYNEDLVRREDWKLLHDKLERQIGRGEIISPDELDNLKDLSLFKEEKEAYEKLKKSNVASLNGVHADFVTQKNKEFDEAKKEYESLSKAVRDEDIAKLRVLQTKVEKIKNDFADYSMRHSEVKNDVVKAFSDKCSTLLANIQNVLNHNASESQLASNLDNLTSRMTSESSYVETLQFLVAQNSSSEYADDFKKVIETRSQWGQPFKWNEFIDNNTSVFSGNTLKQDILKTFITQWNDLSFKPTALSTVKRINQRLPYYQSIVDNKLSSVLMPLNKLCYYYFKSDLWYIDTPEGKRHYFKQKPHITKIKGIYSLTNLTTGTEELFIAEPSMEFKPLGNCKFCQKIKDSITQIKNGGNMTIYGIQILTDIYTDSSLQDPLIKYIFLTTAVDCLSKSDKIIGDLFNPILTLLHDDSLLNANPFDPKKSDKNRTAASKKLSGIPNFNKNLSTAQKYSNELFKSYNYQKLKPVGWLEKTTKGWTIKGLIKTEDSKAYIVQNNELVEIGTISSNISRITVTSDLVRGMPVFIITTGP